jgi:hypothetical protein
VYGQGEQRLVAAGKGRETCADFLCYGSASSNRTFIIAAFGSTILIIPFIVVITSYKDNPARIQVQTWCASFLFLFASLYWSNAYVRSFCTILYSL